MKRKSEVIESEALKLDPRSRARLAERLLESLETLSETEIQALWEDESERRDLELDKDPNLARSAGKVLRKARSKSNR